VLARAVQVGGELLGLVGLKGAEPRRAADIGERSLEHGSRVSKRSARADSAAACGAVGFSRTGPSARDACLSHGTSDGRRASAWGKIGGRDCAAK